METGDTRPEGDRIMVGEFRERKNDKAFGSFLIIVVGCLVLSASCVAATFPQNVEKTPFLTTTEGVSKRLEPSTYNGATGWARFCSSGKPKVLGHGIGTDQSCLSQIPPLSLKFGSTGSDERSSETQRGIGQNQYQSVGDRQTVEAALCRKSSSVGDSRAYVLKSRGLKAEDGSCLQTDDCENLNDGKTIASYVRRRAASSVFESKRIVQSSPEAQVLLAWRAGLIDGPRSPLANWNFSVQSNVCRWRGVGCDRAQQHVISITLPGRKIGGVVSSGLSQLPFLAAVDLSYNHLTGGIPGDLVNSVSLRSLNLSFNALNGSIPSFCSGVSNLTSLNLMKNRLNGSIPKSLGECKQLQQLRLARNSLRGGIPAELGTLPNLQVLYLYQNKLGGQLPAALGSSSGLVDVQLGGNQLSGGIPVEYSNLTALQGFYLQDNNLTGDLPSWLADFPNLSFLNLSNNEFRGSIPQLLGSSKKLISLNLSNNFFEGPIPTGLVESLNLTTIDLSSNLLNGSMPAGLSTVSTLQDLRLAQNLLTGSIPDDIGQLASLNIFDLSGNSLENSLPELGALTKLTVLNLANNQFTGSFPATVGQLAELQVLSLGNNQLTGSIPGTLGHLAQLQVLSLENNLLSGTIPATLGQLVQLQVLSLGINQFTGNIPSEISACINLTILSLNDNMLNGSIPDSFGQFPVLKVLHLEGNLLSGSLPTGFNLTSLEDFVLSDNQLTGGLSGAFVSTLSQLQSNFSIANNQLSGPLPKELGSLNLVQTLNLSGNSFVSTIPDEISNCKALLQLDISRNNLTGFIPPSLGSLNFLQVLNLSSNMLNGNIPTLFGALSALSVLDLTANNLSGGIPSSLISLSNLKFLNVSENNLEGAVPTGGPFGNFSNSSYVPGNPGLCGFPLVKSCNALSNKGKKKKALSAGSYIGIGCGSAAFLSLIIASVYLCWRFMPIGRPPKKRGSIIARSELFYPQLRFTVQDLKFATENFSSVNILGSGSLSNVYRGVLPELVLVAVKKLKIPSGTRIPHGFLEELDDLGKLRNRNLVSILGHCFDMEVNAIVVQFMSNGSLEEHLHRGQTCDLDWPARAKVGIGIAKALSFLHHECGTPIVHCDVKPSNVLLDAEFEAHLEDFGLSRLIFVHKLMDMTDSSVGSSIGYFPPEYGFSPLVSTKGDVYSYGILLLELLTGKKPTIDMFKDDLSLTKWCEAAFPSQIMDVLDPSLLGLETTDERQVNLFMKVALMCARDIPEDRPTIKTVLEMLR